MGRLKGIHRGCSSFSVMMYASYFLAVLWSPVYTRCGKTVDPAPIDLETAVEPTPEAVRGEPGERQK
eukprot:scaffold24029_cov14-Tisochrysis_lutea.AAC.1